MRYNRKLLLSSLITVGLIGFGVLANWYLVYVLAAQPLVIKEAPNPYQELYDELLRPSVRVMSEQGVGSGVVIFHHGDTENTENTIYILTTAHVVGNYSSVTVTLYSYTNNQQDVLCDLSASVVITDSIKDLALLRTYTYKPYPYVAQLAPRDYVPYIFTPVWVVGCSLGYEPRPTAGEITRVSYHGDTENTEKNLRDLRASVVNHWEINAPIWPGNSGGGVFLKETNELIGIAVRVRVYYGPACACPHADRQLVSTMGSIVTLTDIYEFLQSPLIRACLCVARRQGDLGVCDTPPPPRDRGE